jgi:NADH:ubiquinone oxidoreductase subunit 4 (subunit M)
MYIIIGIYGARQEKIKAAYYFFYYTLAGSILMLISIIYLFITYGTTNYFTLLSLIPSNLPLNIENLLFLGFFMGLAVKIPKFPFHI